MQWFWLHLKGYHQEENSPQTRHTKIEISNLNRFNKNKINYANEQERLPKSYNVLERGFAERRRNNVPNRAKPTKENHQHRANSQAQRKPEFSLVNQVAHKRNCKRYIFKQPQLQVLRLIK